MNATVGVGATSVNVDSEAAKSRVTGPEKASNPISGL